MALPPAVIIHGLADAKAARVPGLPVTLISAPGAAAYAGCLWWRELIAASGFTGTHYLDCGPHAGRAVEALQLGLPGIIFTGPPALQRAVAGVADQTGAVLLSQAPPAFDMAGENAATRFSAWLAGG